MSEMLNVIQDNAITIKVPLFVLGTDTFQDFTLRAITQLIGHDGAQPTFVIYLT